MSTLIPKELLETIPDLYVIGLESALGYFSLQELQSLKQTLGIRVERDEPFMPTPVSIIKY